MSELPMTYNRERGKWEPNPNYVASADPWKVGPDDYRSDTDSGQDVIAAANSDVYQEKSALDPDVLDPSTLRGLGEIVGTPLVAPLPFRFIDGAGRPIGNGTDPGLLPPRSGRVDYAILKSWDEPPGPGKAFDTKSAVEWLLNNHACTGDSYGYCQRAVWTALHNGGMNVPRFGAAKEMAGYLASNANFSAVASGLGNSFDASTSANYHAQVGDIQVYRGCDSARGGETGTYGHIQMCVGFDKTTGEAVWMSDFQTRPGNMSGLRDPVGHGGEFVIFRQHTEAPAVALNKDGPAAGKEPPAADKAATAVTTAQAAKPKPTLPAATI